MGIPLRLDFIPGDPNGNNRRRRRIFCQVSGCVCSVVKGPSPDKPAWQNLSDRSQTSRRSGCHFIAFFFELFWNPGGRQCSESLYVSQGARVNDPNRSWPNVHRRILLPFFSSDAGPRLSQPYSPLFSSKPLTPPPGSVREPESDPIVRRGHDWRSV